MTKFSDTLAASEFIASAASRETSPRVMEAIASIAMDDAEAEAIWSDGRIGADDFSLSVWEISTSNGVHDDEALFWGGRSLKNIMAGG